MVTFLVGTELGAFKSLDADTYRALATAKRVDVLRNGQKVSLTMPGNLDLLDMIKSTPRFVDVFIPNTVDSVMSELDQQLKRELKQAIRL